MTYRYEFDDTPVGNLRFDRSRYEHVQDSLRMLQDELTEWNQRAREHGAVGEPYAQEVSDLNGMIEWGDARLVHSDVAEITVPGISVGSLRYIKAALLLNTRRREEERERKANEGWPDGALQSLDTATERLRQIAEHIKQPPAEVLWQVMLRERDAAAPEQATMEWDVFISHASEDKEQFVRPLAEALQAQGLRVWYDELSLNVGDSLRRSIDRGLAHSIFGVVVISNHFLQKEWPQRELDGLVAREIEGVKIILPVWHNITKDEIIRHSPTLADRVAISSGAGLDKVVADLLRAIGKNGEQIPTSSPVSVSEEANIQEWHTTSHARYLKLLAERGQEWLVSVEEHHYQLSFELLGQRQKPITSNDLRSILQTAEQHVRKEVWTGWSMFHLFNRPELGPYKFAESLGGKEVEMLEACALGRARSSTTVPDFWRVSTTGVATLVRAYREDRQVIEMGGARLQPGTYLAPRTLVRELYEFACFAREISNGIPGVTHANFLCTWRGLENRRINDARPGIEWNARTSHTDTRTASAAVTLKELGEWPSLVVAALANPVFRLFDGLELGPEWIKNERPNFRAV